MEKKLIDSLGGAMFCANRNFYQNSWKIQQGKHDTYQGRRKVLKFGGAYTRCFELTSFFSVPGKIWGCTSVDITFNWSAHPSSAVDRFSENAD